MPTGYTDAVGKGEITDLRSFAFRCARNFGALVSMRDKPWDAPLPESFEPSGYHDEHLTTALEELDRFLWADGTTIRKLYDEHNASYRRLWEERTAHRNEQRTRYEAMLAQVRAWEPPTEGHRRLKDFMVEQLVESISADCSSDYDDEPKPVDLDKFYCQRLEQLAADVKYHGQHRREERERCAKRSEWIKQLRDSFRTDGRGDVQ